MKIPHPLPYQGSKRKLANLISSYIPMDIDVWYEPFAGSAAMSLWMAHYRKPNRIIIGDSLKAITDLWTAIIDYPEQTSNRYSEIWHGQHHSDQDYFNSIRERYNTNQDPIDLLYLICRCVKNAVRFSSKGLFTQSVDKRRLGMHPEKMNLAIQGASSLLRGKTEIRNCDWLDTISDTLQNDFVYLDPPYLGTSIGRDKRYSEQVKSDQLIDGIRSLNQRKIRFALSYDGQTGNKIYGPPLPSELGLTQILLDAGISSQSTLNGKSEKTIESLYLSPNLNY